MKPFYLAAFICAVLLNLNGISAQNKDRIIQEIQDYQNDMDLEFGDPEQSILKPEDLTDFKGLNWYPIDLNYRVTARLERTPDAQPFLMPTTTDRTPEYVQYGILHFTLNNLELQLPVYRSAQGYEDPQYADYLFCPFTDWASGDGAYGGGRYIDLRIPEGDELVLDFNQSYNPYCAYNERYSCPIPPKENDLPIRIEAGVMAFQEH
ncbi:MAG TPA: hypothetical protein DCZ44_00510 [Flavobacteriaceae bacterium]|nr:hypothetical protein [Flavobacteriaceae bacterium]